MIIYTSWRRPRGNGSRKVSSIFCRLNNEKSWTSMSIIMYRMGSLCWLVGWRKKVLSWDYLIAGSGCFFIAFTNKTRIEIVLWSHWLRPLNILEDTQRGDGEYTSWRRPRGNDYWIFLEEQNETQIRSTKTQKRNGGICLDWTFFFMTAVDCFGQPEFDACNASHSFSLIDRVNLNPMRK